MDDWERRAAEAESERRAAAEKWAWMVPHFSFRDAARTSGLVTVVNAGPGSATDVKLDVWVEANGLRVEVLCGDDDVTSGADRLDPNESLHASVVFATGGPPVDELRYSVAWTDGGAVPRSQHGHLPVPRP